MRIRAFRGIRYGEKQGPVGDPGSLVAPPYDQINDALRDVLHRVHPNHFAHLIRPVPGELADMYEHATAQHSRWLAEGVAVMDSSPAVYPYAIELAGGGQRLGITALVDLEAPASGVIRPHEQTLDKPLADRLALLRTSKLDLEPVLLTYEDEGWLDSMLADDVQGRAPLVVHNDVDGNRHLLFRIDDPARIEEYREVLAQRPAAIADGHHRYKTALLYQSEIAAEPGVAAAAKLAVVTSIASKGLTIDPIHRALRALPRIQNLHNATTARAPWHAPINEASPGTAFARAVAAAPQPSLGVWPRGGTPEIWHLDPGKAPTRVAPSARGLSVVLLQEVLYPGLQLPPEAATDGTVLYRSDPNELYGMITSGEAGLGLWLPPMSPMAFSVAIANGDLLPPKSTRFLPKVYSGLVWAAHGTELG
jgi:uncharacterized protein (DUF1015 family)